MKRVSKSRNNQVKRQGAFVRRAPFLISYWQGKSLYFENYLTRKKIAASIQTAALLDFFSSWKPEAAMLRRWPEYTSSSLRRAVHRLVQETFLQRSALRNPPSESRERLLRNWRAWNPAASYFHLSTKDSYDQEITPEAIRHAEGLLQSKRVPLPVKSYLGVRTLRFAKENYIEEFPQLLRERRTWREFGKAPVRQEALGRLLHLSFGVQRWERVPKIGRFALKSSPSAGGLHPLESYVLVRNVQNVPSGIYHYDADRRGLQLIRAGANSAEIQRFLAGQWWFRRAAFVVLLTGIFHRTQWKYDYARAYRAVLAEAGHFCQTFCLTATWLGLAPFCTMALADTQIEKALRVDGISESVLYAMGAGTKPAKE
jgi:SagB-type dehydrogenase family enzyme